LPTLRWTPLHPLPPRADFPTRFSSSRLGRISHFFAEPILLCPRSYLPDAWRRNLYRLPIGCPFRVPLRSGLPWVDDPSPGTLRLSGRRILTVFSLLMPASSLALRPAAFAVRLSPSAQCSPTNAFAFRGFGESLQPPLSSAQPVLTGELLRTLSRLLLLSPPPRGRGHSTSLHPDASLRDLSRRFGLFPARPGSLSPTGCLPGYSLRYSQFG